MKSRIAIALLIAGLVAGCPSTGTKQSVMLDNTNFRSFAVGFSANPGAGSLNANTPNRGCTAGNGKGPGCVAFEKGIFGTLSVYIKGAAIDEQCAPQGPPNYVITKIAVTDKQIGTSEKGDFPPNIASKAWMEAAFPTIDMSTGVVYDVAYDNGATPQGAFINYNAHDNADGVKNIWYQVTATKCDGSATLVSDPRVRNYGK